MESNDIMLPSPPSALTLHSPPKNLPSQIKRTTRADAPNHQKDTEHNRTVWRNKLYVLEESLSRKGFKGFKLFIPISASACFNLVPDDVCGISKQQQQSTGWPLTFHGCSTPQNPAVNPTYLHS
ncbi:Levodione reductase [Fusarium oxysporum f. sp. albedinis]|nr:Levodione reductase [Fusarium oxysporum f. sp. albedinis]